jgi:hypothetical protein
MEDQGTLTDILFVRFFVKICERGRSVRSLFHTVLQVNERSTAATCEVFICTYHTNIHFLNCNVTGDESLVFLYYLARDLWSMEWGTKISSGHDKFCFRKSRIWMMLITFYVNRVWHTVNQCQQINSDKCVLYTVAGKVIDVDFKSEATVLREKKFISFAWQCPCSFCRNSEGLSWQITLRCTSAIQLTHLASH